MQDKLESGQEPLPQQPGEEAGAMLLPQSQIQPSPSWQQMYTEQLQYYVMPSGEPHHTKYKRRRGQKKRFRLARIGGSEQVELAAYVSLSADLRKSTRLMVGFAHCPLAHPNRAKIHRGGFYKRKEGKGQAGYGAAMTQLELLQAEQNVRSTYYTLFSAEQDEAEATNERAVTAYLAMQRRLSEAEGEENEQQEEQTGQGGLSAGFARKA